MFSGIFGSTPPGGVGDVHRDLGRLRRRLRAVRRRGPTTAAPQQLEVHGGDVAVGGDLTVGTGAALLTDPRRIVTVGGHIGDVGGLRATPGRGSVPADPFATQLAALAALPEAAPSRPGEALAGRLGRVPAGDLPGRQHVQVLRSRGVRADRFPFRGRARRSRCAGAATAWSST